MDLSLPSLVADTAGMVDIQHAASSKKEVHNSKFKLALEGPQGTEFVVGRIPNVLPVPPPASETTAISNILPSMSISDIVPEAHQTIPAVPVPIHPPVKFRRNRTKDLRRMVIRNAAWNSWLSAEVEAPSLGEDSGHGEGNPPNKSTGVQNPPVATPTGRYRVNDLPVARLSSQPSSDVLVPEQQMIHKLPPKPPASVCVDPMTFQSQSSTPLESSQTSTSANGPDDIEGFTVTPPDHDTLVSSTYVPSANGTRTLPEDNTGLDSVLRGPMPGIRDRTMYDVAINEAKEAIETIESTKISPPFGRSTARTLGGDRNGEDPAYLSDSGSTAMDLDSDDEEQYQTASEGQFPSRRCHEAPEESIAPPLSAEVIPSAEYLVADTSEPSEDMPLQVYMSRPSHSGAYAHMKSNESRKTVNLHAGKPVQDPKLKPQALKAVQKKPMSAPRNVEWGPTTKKDPFLPAYK